MTAQEDSKSIEFESTEKVKSTEKVEGSEKVDIGELEALREEVGRLREENETLCERIKALESNRVDKSRPTRKSREKSLSSQSALMSLTQIGASLSLAKGPSRVSTMLRVMSFWP